MIAAVFPGQGSQKPGMAEELYLNHEEARRIFDIASEAIGVNLRALCLEADEETLKQTENTQIALFVSSVAAYEVIPETIKSRIQAMAGHSVGEYAALTCAGILDVATGAKLVRKRGELMASSGKATPGSMAAILGLDRDKLESLCKEAEGAVVVANDNCPGQLVISGEAAAVKRVGELAATSGAKRVLPLNVSGAFHSPLMNAPAEEMADHLAGATFQTGLPIRVYSNVTAEPVDNPILWPTLLEAQLRSTVRWTETVQNMIRDGVLSFIEVGSGEVLSGLIRRIDKTVSLNRVSDDSTLANTIHDLG